MTPECEYIEKCPFFDSYLLGKNGHIKGWQISFCHTLVLSEDCMRKKYRREHGEPAPPNMTPLGDYLD